MEHPDRADIDEQVRAFDEGRASARMDARVVRVSGADARRWLDDLVTAGIGSLSDGEQVRSLLLTPTGRIRADFHVVVDGSAFLLIQGLDQPSSIRDLLERYVLSSDVDLDDVGDAHVRVVAGDPDPLVVLGDFPGDRARADAFHAWRIRRGLARFPTDVDADSTPAEGGLDRLIDVTKGCFLGQEAVAKIRNLGHPARVTIALSAPPGTVAGDEVTVEGRLVGTITSAAPARDHTDVIARVAWRDRAAALGSPAGLLARI